MYLGDSWGFIGSNRNAHLPTTNSSSLDLSRIGRDSIPQTHLNHSIQGIQMIHLYLKMSY